MKLPLVIFFLFSTLFVCQSQSFHFYHLDVENGLSQNSVLCVAQDSRGLMWFGTRFGLNKYDSRKITVYKNRPGDSTSLSNNYILSLLCDSYGTLWVGTRNGLHRYIAAEDRFERITLDPQAGRAVTCLFEDSKKRLWVGTSTLFLLTNRNKPSFLSFATVKNFPSRGVLCMYEDRSGNIWSGTYHGVAKLTASGNHFDVSVLQHDPADPNGISDNQVSGIVQDTAGYLWMATTNGGLNRYDTATNRFTHYRHSEQLPNSLVNDHVRKLLYHGTDELWIGTQEGLCVLNMRTGLFTAYTNDPWNKNSLSQNSVHSLYKDNTGVIWIGTFFGGVNYYAPQSTGFTVYNNSSRPYTLNNNVISSIVEDDQNNCWIGTEGGGLNYLDRTTGKVKYYQHKASDATSIGSNLVKTLYKDRQGNIWAGTHGGGLNLFEPSTQHFKRYLYKDNDPQTLGSEIPCLLEDSKGIFWVGTEIYGLKLFRKQHTMLTPYPEGNPIIKAIGNQAILSLLETKERGDVWVGTASGLYLVSGNQVRLLENTSGGYPFHVNSVMEDLQGNIWAGTYYHGLIVYNSAGNKLRTYTQQHGLPDNNVLGVLQDSNSKAMWISTANGLARIQTAGQRITVYTEADGLAGNVFNNNAYYQSKQGELFFGGYNGLSVFHPANIKENTGVPPVIITDLKLSGKPVAINGPDHILSKDISFTPGIRLNHDQNTLTLEFAILNFIKPEKNRYAYKLDGFDKDWNYTSLAAASYTNLPPGHYTFSVKGANNDGTWSQAAALGVTILPPFWKTWWAYGIYGLLFVTLAFFIARFFFLRALYRRNQELTQLKLNFFTNISHEIRTHLSLITGPAEKLIHTGSNDQHDQQLLRTIKVNSDSLLQLVNELMDFRKAETGHLPLQVSRWDIVSFVQAVVDSFHDLSVSRNIQTDFITSAKNMEAWFDKEQLKKVFYNLLFNAFKFTPDGGYISVSIEEKEADIAIRVMDNGRGIAREHMERLFDNYFQGDDHGQQNTGYGIGLALSKSIVELHKGSLTVSSEMATGEQYTTCFTVTLLKGHHHFSKEQVAEHPLPPASQHADNVLLSPLSPEPVPVPVTKGDSSKNTILLVEDNTGIRSFIKNALGQQYLVLESNNGQEGLLCALETIPDLIISDVMMPEMDGFTFCGKIKNDIRTSHIPVILLTAKTEVNHHISGLQTGAEVYLTKPFSIQVLELQIRNLLAARETWWQQFRSRLAPDMPDDASPEHTQVSVPAAETVATAVLHPMDEAFLQQIIQLVQEHMDNPDFGIALLAKKAAMSQPVLFKKIKAITGMSANDFVKSLRLKRATELLQENRYTVYEIAYMVGYENSKYFSREFKKQFGVTPSEYGKTG
jgi:ligand-binding sensor domain-containing protein/signal transduction histidine kinase/DNA-binding response OmpR family regulator